MNAASRGPRPTKPTGKVWRIKNRDENGNLRDFNDALEIATRMRWWKWSLKYDGLSAGWFTWSDPDSIPVNCRGPACACGRCMEVSK